MIIDKSLEFSDAQALTATAASTNSIDFTHALPVAPGEPLWCVITVDVAMGGTSPTFQASIETDDNSSFSSAATQLTGKSYTALAAGTKIVLPMAWVNERYMRLKYTMGGTSPTVTVSAALTNQEPPAWQALPDGI